MITNFKVRSPHCSFDNGIIINDDCINILYDMPNNSVDYTFTSPPYNRKRNDKYSYYIDIKNDWYEFNSIVIEQLMRVTKNHVFYNLQANYYNRKELYKLIGHFSDYIVDIHIWQKTNPMPASGFSITNAVEYFLVLGKKPLKSNKTYTKNIITTSVNSKMPKELKAVMKTEVAQHFIETFTKKNDIVLDCFSGYGTTALMCKKLQRKFIAIEMQEKYYQMSINRLINNI